MRTAGFSCRRTKRGPCDLPGLAGSVRTHTLPGSIVLIALSGIWSNAILAAPCPSVVADATSITHCTLTGTDSTTISSSGAIASGSSQSAIDITSDGGIGLVNDGTIRTDLGGSGAWARSIYDNGSLIGTIINNGVIGATTQTSTGNAKSDGILVISDMSGRIDNLGQFDISATTLSGTGYADGILVNQNLTGQLTNSGTVSVQTSSPNGAANTDGINVLNDLSGSVSNDGLINATATSSNNAFSAGIRIVNGTLSGTLTNNRTITAGATSSASGALGVGIDLNTVGLAGTLVNAGTIRANAQAPAGAAVSIGIYVSGSLSGRVINSGAISGSADDPSNAYSLYISGGTGTVDNQAGGQLYGDIYVGGSVAVNNAGNIAIPNGTSGGITGQIQGNYTQQPAGVLTLGAISAGNHASLNVAGTADLSAGNTIAIHASPANTLATHDTLNAVLSAGTLVTGASGVNVIGTPMFTYSASVAGNKVDITITGKNTIAGVLRQTSGSTFSSLGNTLNQLAAAYSGSNALDPIVAALYSTNSAAELTSAARQLTPQATMSLDAESMRVTQYVGNVIEARQNGAVGPPFGGAHYSGRYFWYQPFGGRTYRSASGASSGYTANTNGIATGIDAAVSDSNRLGVAFAYARTHLAESSVDQTGNVDTYQLAVYDSYALNSRSHLDLRASYALADYRETRWVTLGTIGGSAGAGYRGSNILVGANLVRTYLIGNATRFSPSLRLGYGMMHADGYAESGALPRLVVAGNTTRQLVLGAGGRVVHTVNRQLQLAFGLRAGYDALAKRDSVDAAFADGGSAFTTEGLPASRWQLGNSIGLIFVNHAGLRLSARYAIETQSTDLVNQSVSVRMRIPF